MLYPLKLLILKGSVMLLRLMRAMLLYFVLGFIIKNCFGILYKIGS